MMATEYKNWRKYLQKKLQYERRVCKENSASASEILHSSETSLNALECSNVSESILKTVECNSIIIKDEQVELANLPLKKRKWCPVEDSEESDKENPVKRCKY